MEAGEQTRVEPAASGGLRRRLVRMLNPTALVALAAAVLALTFTLFPHLAPDPGTTYSADVGVFAVERGVTFGEYLHRIAFSPERYRARRAELLRALGAGGADPAGMLALPGELVYVSSEVKGFKHGSVALRWSLYGASSLRRVPGKTFGDVLAVQLDLDAPTDRTMQLVWIPPPPGRGPYVVRVGLYDERDTLLDVADSRPFLAG